MRARSLDHKRSARRGYTVVEVLAAMTLFMIGAAGVISMQRVTIQGGADARRFDVGSNIANEWAHRLQRDSLFWTQPNSANPSTSNLTTHTKWLAATPTAGWVTPPMPAAGAESGMSPAFDVYGRDLAAGSADIMYCVQYRLSWIANPNTPSAPGALIRAEVRVFWPRFDQPPIADCATPNPAPTVPNVYHFVYVTTAIRQNPDQ